MKNIFAKILSVTFFLGLIVGIQIDALCAPNSKGGNEVAHIIDGGGGTDVDEFFDCLESYRNREEAKWWCKEQVYGPNNNIVEISRLIGMDAGLNPIYQVVTFSHP